MKEPLRWLNDSNTSAALREVLRSSTPTPDFPEQAHQQLSAYAAGLVSPALAVGGAASQGLAQSFLGKLAHSVLLRGLILGAVAGTAVTASYDALRPSGQPPAQSAVPRAPTAAPASPGKNALEPAPFASEPDGVIAGNAGALPPLPQVASVPSSSLRGVRLPEVGASSSPPTGDSPEKEPGIAVEARLLERARSELAGRPGQALELAARHQRQYPTGQLSAERELIVVDALLRLGRRAEAEQRAAPQIESHPDSLYARRMRQLLGGAER